MTRKNTFSCLHHLTATVAFLSAVFVTQTSNAAYFILSSQKAEKIDRNARTHVIINGIGHDLGSYPVMSARAKMDRILKAFPNDQVVVFNPVDDSSGKNSFEKMGYNIAKYSSDKLIPKTLMDEVVQFKKIASVNTYGHSAIPEGIFLDSIGSKDVRFYPTDTEFDRLANHFTDDAFAVLNGCNAGHILAPLLSKKWGIPVAGALTGSHFETIYNDKAYYWADGATKSSWLASNTSDFILQVRLRPDNANYTGHYGHYPQGLPFYKFFCSGVETSKCLLGMGQSARVIVSTVNLSEKINSQNYGDVVREWLCPTAKFGSSVQKNCIKYLESIDLNSVEKNEAALQYTPFAGRTMQCTFESCYEDAKCSIPQNTWGCAKSTVKINKSTTFVREYIAYMQGLQILRQQQKLN